MHRNAPKSSVSASRRSPPNFVHEGLLIAIEEKKKTAVAAVISQNDPRRPSVLQSLRFAPDTSFASYLENVGLSDAESVRTFFLGKAVLDIGGGFGGAPRIFLGIARHVTVADPIFAEPNWNELFLSDLGKIGMKMDLLKGKIREALESERSGLEARLIESSRIRAEMLFWVDFNPIAPRGGLSINPSYGEHLVNVPDSSQDVVFLNHVLFKDTAYPERILVEAFRVLASGGKIFVNNTHSDEKVRFFRGFEKDWNVVFHRSDSVISVEMTRK